jgi:amino acid adenylation domain-containing protein
MSAKTLVEVLRQNASGQGAEKAFTFLVDGETQQQVVTYAGLDTRARAIAAHLESLDVRGKRALLLYAPEMEYVFGFLGCIFAGVVAVPAYPPDPSRLERTLPRLRAIAEDSGAEIVLTTSEIRGLAEFLFTQAPELAEKHWIATDKIGDDGAEGWTHPDISPDALAFIQYTSGSTGLPKGVVLSHDNLRTNLGMILDAFGAVRESVGVSWLPPYHDMGLIGGILGPIACGAHSALMSPLAFLKRPMRWLEAISRFGATISGGPNFAYELCIRRATDEDVERLDLSSWGLAFSGAEPVRPDTLDRFVDRFKRCGFDRNAFYPCYGLAEATLIVSGGARAAAPLSLAVDPSALERGEAKFAEDGRLLVGCGQPLGGQQVLVVDPSTCVPVADGTVGEVWVSGASVAKAYWNRPDETAQSLAATLAGDSDSRYLRTGDLAFINDGELYITGRVKDLIIVRGRNLYPQDLERTAEECHPSLRRGCSAAFSMEIDGSEEVVLVIELERRHRERRRNTEPPEPNDRRGNDRRGPDDVSTLSNTGAPLPGPSDLELVCAEVSRAVAAEHDVSSYIVALVKAGNLPKTSSGKIQRSETRRMLAAGELDILERTTLDAPAQSMRRPPVSSQSFDHLSVSSGSKAQRREAVMDYLLNLISSGLGIPRHRVATDKSVAQLGLDSLAAVEIVHELERQFGAILPTTTLLRGGTLETISDQIVAGLGSAPPDGPALDEETTSGLSSGQEGLWLLQQIDPQSAAYNVACSLQLVGELSDEALRDAFLEITQRHEVLRQRYPRDESGSPTVVLDENPLDYVVVNALGWSDADLDRRAAEEAFRPFDLETGPLLRVVRLQRGDDAVLVVSTHHIAVDFWAMTMLLEQLSEVINGRAQGVRSLTTPVERRYGDFVQWQRRRVHAVAGERVAFWRKELAGAGRLDLPLDRPRPSVQSFRGDALQVELPTALVKQVRELAKAQNTTPFVVFLSAFQLLLSRVTSADDVVVATAAAGRPRADFADVVGLFINPVMIRAQVDDDTTFSRMLDRVRESVLDALDRQDFPFAELVKELDVQRDPARPPIFDVMFAYEQGHQGKDEWARLALGIPGQTIPWGKAEVTSRRLPQRSVQNDLTMMVADTKQGNTLWLHYCVDLFDRATIERFCEYYVRTLTVSVAHPKSRSRALPLLTRAERSELLAACRGPERDSELAPVHDMVARQATLTPDRIAVSDGAVELSYAALVAQADHLAARLQDTAPGVRAPIGVLLPRSADLVVAQLAAMKVGSGYLPLDPDFPVERLAYMVADSGAKAVITTEDLGASLAATGLEFEVLRPDQATGRQPSGQVELEQLAYVMYTSGSTGRPKGVAVPHRSVSNFLASMVDSLAITAKDRLAAVTTTSFDISVLELFLPLTVGARVEVLQDEQIRDGRKLRHALIEGGATMMQATPALWSMLEDAGGGPRPLRALCGGEALPNRLAQALVARHGQVVNLYGPTETTIWSSYDVIASRDGPVTLGRPIAETSVYVLDHRQQPVPAGLRGEIYIGGQGVVRGYLNRPSLTAERFVPDPFGEPGARMYRTGDIGRRLADGRVEYLGREDQQIKLRGYRIELGEIERVIGAHPGVRDAAVIVGTSPAGPVLVGVVVANATESVGADALRAHAYERLPRYMVPARIEVVPELPQTPNGKIDRRALVALAEETRAQSDSVPAKSEMERKLLEIFESVLDASGIGVTDDFFALGGHSLMATRIATRASRELNMNVPVRSIFECPTVRVLATQLESTRTVNSSVRRGGALFKPISRAPRRVARTAQGTPEDPPEGPER